jgi:hypothetical protein
VAAVVLLRLLAAVPFLPSPRGAGP